MEAAACEKKKKRVELFLSELIRSGTAWVLSSFWGQEAEGPRTQDCLSQTFPLEIAAMFQSSPAAAAAENRHIFQVTIVRRMFKPNKRFKVILTPFFVIACKGGAHSLQLYLQKGTK